MQAQERQRIGGDPPDREGAGVGNMVLDAVVDGRVAQPEDPIMVDHETEQRAGLSSEQSCNRHRQSEQIDKTVQQPGADAHEGEPGGEPAQQLAAVLADEDQRSAHGSRDGMFCAGLVLRRHGPDPVTK